MGSHTGVRILLLSVLVGFGLGARADDVDFTAAERGAPDAPGIVSFKITADFPVEKVRKFCQGTLLRRIPHPDRCEYVVVTAAHCLVAPQAGAPRHSELAAAVHVDRFQNFKSFWVEAHPHWMWNSGSNVGVLRGTDLGFVRFHGPCRELDAPFVSLWDRRVGDHPLWLASLNQQSLLPAQAREPEGLFKGSLPVSPPSADWLSHWIRHGDSGGGCFVRQGEKMYLAGVLSYTRDNQTYCTAPRALRWLEREVLAD